ncbi:hypothetical protein G6F46_015628 [Rhizopus delemar]|nr:hypothetical protein G6F46_015628 [Rhizopus delemar]
MPDPVVRLPAQHWPDAAQHDRARGRSPLQERPGGRSRRSGRSGTGRPWPTNASLLLRLGSGSDCLLPSRGRSYGLR